MGRWAGQAPKDAAEETKDAASVFGVGVESAEQEAQVMAVGGLHGAGRVFGGEHRLFNDAREEIEFRGDGGGVGCGVEFRWCIWRGLEIDAFLREARIYLIEADCDSLAEVH